MRMNTEVKTSESNQESNIGLKTKQTEKANLDASNFATLYIRAA